MLPARRQTVPVLRAWLFSSLVGLWGYRPSPLRLHPNAMVYSLECVNNCVLAEYLEYGHSEDPGCCCNKLPSPKKPLILLSGEFKESIMHQRKMSALPSFLLAFSPLFLF